MTARPSTPRATVVVGIGQPLGGDDAVGLVVAAHLRTTGIQATSVEDGAALAELLSTAERAVIIDAVVGAGPPGTVIHLRGDELTELATSGIARASAAPLSSHGLSVALAVSIARALGGAAEAHLVGIAIAPPRDVRQSLPRDVRQSLPHTASASLSEPVAAAVELAAARVRELLRAPGAEEPS